MDDEDPLESLVAELAGKINEDRTQRAAADRIGPREGELAADFVRATDA